MALKSTILKAQVSLSDMDRHYYQELSLTIAQHPSENAQRLMVRLLAYLLNADSNLEFTKGLCADDEPEIWRKSLSGEVLLWVELGLPDEKRLKKPQTRHSKFCFILMATASNSNGGKKTNASLPASVTSLYSA